MGPHLWTSLMVAAALVSCGGEETRPRSVVVHHELAVADVTVTDLYAPTDVEDAPVVVLLHGGFGEHERMAPLARELAATGVVVYVPTWPVIPIGFDGDVTTEMYRAQAEAVVCSLRYARVTASDHGGDGADLTLVGHSAGAAAGARVAIVDDPPWTGIDCFDGVPHTPSRFVGSAGDYGGATQYSERDPELFAPFSPLRVTPTNPDLQAALIHGVDDTNVYPSGAVEFRDHLASVGIEVPLVQYDGGHGELIDPSTPAGEYLVGQLAALVHGRPNAFAPHDPVVTLRYGEAGCSADGVDGAARFDAVSISLVNDSDVSVWFAIVGFRTAEEAEAASSRPWSIRQMSGGPSGIDAIGFRPVPPDSTDVFTWVFLNGTSTWWTYCLPDAGSDDPRAGLMLPAGPFRMVPAAPG